MSPNPNSTTNFDCRNLFQVQLSKVFTLQAIFTLEFISYCFSSNTNLATVSLCSLCLERSAVTVIKNNRTPYMSYLLLSVTSRDALSLTLVSSYASQLCHIPYQDMVVISLGISSYLYQYEYG